LHLDLLFCNSFLQHHPTPLAGHRQEKTEKMRSEYEMDVAPYENGKPIYYDFTACPAAEFAKLGFSPGTTFAACVRCIE